MSTRARLALAPRFAPTEARISLRVSTMLLGRFDDVAERRTKRTGQRWTRARLMQRALERACDELAREEREAKARTREARRRAAAAARARRKGDA